MFLGLSSAWWMEEMVRRDTRVQPILGKLDKKRQVGEEERSHYYMYSI